MQIIINVPKIPTVFFNILLHPRTASILSPKILPTTGIKLDTAALVVFAVNPSTEEDKVPSKESIDVNIVRIIPNIHTIEDFRNLEIPSSCPFSKILEVIVKLIEIRSIGIKN